MTRGRWCGSIIRHDFNVLAMLLNVFAWRFAAIEQRQDFLDILMRHAAGEAGAVVRVAGLHLGSGRDRSIELEADAVFIEVGVKDEAAIDDAQPGVIAPLLGVVTVKRRQSREAIDKLEHRIEMRRRLIGVNRFKFASALGVNP